MLEQALPARRWPSRGTPSGWCAATRRRRCGACCSRWTRSRRSSRRRSSGASTCSSRTTRCTCAARARSPRRPRKGRAVHALVRGGCALLAAHTNADSAAPGRLGRAGGPVRADRHACRWPRRPTAAPAWGGSATCPRRCRSARWWSAREPVLPATAWGVRAAGDPDLVVRRLAVCGGAGDSLLGAAAAAGAAGVPHQRPAPPRRRRGARGAGAARRRALGDRVAVAAGGRRRAGRSGPAWPRARLYVSSPIPSACPRGAPAREGRPVRPAPAARPASARQRARPAGAPAPDAAPSSPRSPASTGWSPAAATTSSAPRPRRPTWRARPRSSRTRSRRCAPARSATTSGWPRARSRSPSSSRTWSTRTRRWCGGRPTSRTASSRSWSAPRPCRRCSTGCSPSATSGSTAREQAVAAVEAGAGGDRRGAGRATTQERATVAAELPADLLALYERIRAAEGGIGAGEITRGRCGGCRLDLMGNEKAAIRAAAPDEVLRHEECTRIMVRTAESGPDEPPPGRRGGRRARAATPGRRATARSSGTRSPARCWPSAPPASAPRPTTSPSTAA